jgi:predicted AlkP superfamily pyrophosphatase or phosphodiesterase
MLAGLATRGKAVGVRPKLLVLVVLGQFRPEYLDAVRPQLGSGGFKRILEKGVFYYNCINRASSFSSSGLATLATGAWPAQHGIVADRWYDRAAAQAVPANDEVLLGSTLLAEIGDSRARVQVVASSREQAALFAAGVPAEEGNGIFWLDTEGAFRTEGEPPDWLAGFQSPNSAEASRNCRWLAVGARSDAPALRTLNWSPDRPADFMALYRSSPFEQGAIFDFANELIGRNRLGQSNTFDVLCILPTAMQRLGYETGAHSPLMQQMVLQLDRRLELLFGQLAKAPGENAYAFALTAAHGAPAEPPTESRARMAVQGEQLAQFLQKELTDSHLPGVARYVYPFLYLKLDRFQEFDAEVVRRTAARAALAHPAVAASYTAGGDCSLRGDWKRRFRNSFHPLRSGDVMLSYKPGYIEATGIDRGISYGSLYNYDTRVPICFYGPPFRPGVYEQTVETVDFAPTLARVAGVATPSSAVGRVLGEALAP